MPPRREFGNGYSRHQCHTGVVASGDHVPVPPPTTRCPIPLPNRCLQNFHDGYIDADRPLAERTAQALPDYLARQPGTQFSNMTIQRIRKAVTELSSEIRTEMAKSPPRFDAEAAWSQFSESKAFALSLWSSQRTCYGSTYFAYENFLRRVVGTLRSEDDYRARTSDFRNELNRLVSRGMGDSCVDDPDVIIARLTRNCLAHNGGVLDSQLAAKSHAFTIGPDNEICVMPDDIRAMFDVLKGKALDLAKAICKTP